MRKGAIIGVLVSLACLVWVLWGIDFADLGRRLARVGLWSYAGALALLALAFWLRVVRWRLLLAPVARVPLGPLWSATLIGFMANNLLPARMGELARVYALRGLAGIPASSGLATVVVERLLDGLTLLLVVFGALAAADPDAAAGGFSVAYLKGAGYVLLAAYLGGLAVLFCLHRWPAQTTGWLVGLARRLSPRLGEVVGEVLASFRQGLGLLGRAGHLAAIVALSLVHWACYWGQFAVLLPGVGLPARPLLIGLAMAGSTMAAAAPNGPGYVGTLQLAITWALMMGGAAKEPALALSVVFWAVQWFPITLAGLIALWRAGLRLGRLSSQAREGERQGL